VKKSIADIQARRVDHEEEAQRSTSQLANLVNRSRQIQAGINAHIFILMI
jgi:hypothetical protein